MSSHPELVWFASIGSIMGSMDSASVRVLLPTFYIFWSPSLFWFIPTGFPYTKRKVWSCLVDLCRCFVDFCMHRLPQFPVFWPDTCLGCHEGLESFESLFGFKEEHTCHGFYQLQPPTQCKQHRVQLRHLGAVLFWLLHDE